MHRVLTDEDGYHIKPRALLRVRRHHKWLLRTPADKKSLRRNGGQTPAADLQKQGDFSEDHQMQHEVSLGDSGGAGEFSLRPADDFEDNSTGSFAADLMEERRRKMKAESQERWATKKRRRRTRQYAGMPADPPGPPRFRSETTVAESVVILGLDKKLYITVRNKFQAICETKHIMKKTLAGPEVWEAAKNKLVAAFPHLQRVMWIGNNPDRKQLALDVICCDVTKRMRAAGDRGLTLADAKSILGMNPDELRGVKATFYDMLENDGVTSKVLLGKRRWDELKQRWIDESEMLRTALARLYEPTDEEKRAKAVETLARDVMKRLRDNRRGRTNPRTKGKAVTDDTEDVIFDEDSTAMTGDMDGSSDFATMLVADQSHRPRMPPSHLVDSQMQVGMQMPMDDSQLDAQLLLHSDAQTGFMDSHQQFMQTPAPMPSMGPMPTAPSPYDGSQVAAYEMATSNTNMVPIYLRQMAHDHVGPVGDIWIAFLTSPSPSLHELRQIAAQKFPGSACFEVWGLVKVPVVDGLEKYVPLMIHDDNHLAAHLAQEGPPTFHVRLSY